MIVDFNEFLARRPFDDLKYQVSEHRLTRGPCIFRTNLHDASLKPVLSRAFHSNNRCPFVAHLSSCSSWLKCSKVYAFLVVHPHLRLKLPP